LGQHLTAPAGRQSAPKAAGPPPKRRLPRPKPHEKRQKLPVDTSAPFCHYPAMLGETQKPILPHPRTAEYLRAREKQILISNARFLHIPESLNALWRSPAKRFLCIVAGLVAILLGVASCLVPPEVRKRFLETWSPIIQIVAPSLTILSLVLAGRSVIKSEQLANSLSTRFIGTFPDCLDHITKLVNEAENYIYVLWDAADPGSYIKPEAHRRFLGAIVDAVHRKVKVKFLVWGDPQAITYAAEQKDTKLEARQVQTFCELRAQEEGFLERLRCLFAKRYPDRTNLKDVEELLTQPFHGNNTLLATDEGKALFTALLLCYHDWIVERLQNEGVRVVVNKGENDKPPIPDNFFWITDGKQAGFALLCPGKNAPAFYTRDNNLVDTLKDLFDDRFISATTNIDKATDELVPAITALANKVALSKLSDEQRQKGFLVPYSAEEYGDFARRADHFYVLCLGKQLIGFVLAQASDKPELSDDDIYLHIKTTRPQPLILVRQICIAPEFSGRGYGRKLYDYLFKRAGTHPGFDWTAVCFIWKSPANPASEKFHKALGWEELETYTLKNGDGVVGIWARTIRRSD
jgi:predicted GNAT superfamily acetyltransferase